MRWFLDWILRTVFLDIKNKVLREPVIEGILYSDRIVEFTPVDLGFDKVRFTQAGNRRLGFSFKIRSHVNVIELN